MKKTTYLRLLEIDQRAKKAVAIRRRQLTAADKRAEEMRVAADQDFIHWALLTQQPISTEKVQEFIEDKTGLTVRPSGGPRGPRGPRFKPGDNVLINVTKHKRPEIDVTNYQLYDKQYGVVDQVVGDDVYVSFKGEAKPVMFPGGMSPRGVGILKEAPASVQLDRSQVKRVLLEFVYVPGGIPTAEARQVAQDYLNNNPNRKEVDLQYYSGIVLSISEGKNGVYYNMITQQRQTYGGTSANRSFNPSKGTVYYMGVLGQRPRTWKRSLEEFKAENLD